MQIDYNCLERVFLGRRAIVRQARRATETFSDERGGQPSSLTVNTVEQDTTDDPPRKGAVRIKAVGRMKCGHHLKAETHGSKSERHAISHQLACAGLRGVARRIFCGQQALHCPPSPVQPKDNECSRTYCAAEKRATESFYNSSKAYAKYERRKRGVKCIGHHLTDFLVHRFCVCRLHYGDMVHPARRK
jgi:hypothetical protein